MGIERGATSICKDVRASEEAGNGVWELNGMFGELCGAVQHSSSSHVKAPFSRANATHDSIVSTAQYADFSS
jgi:hypothetical protein